MNIFGYINFSFLDADPSKDKSKARAEKKMKELYNPHALQRKFTLFEKLTIPSLAHQTFEEFKLQVIASEFMPREALDQLAERLAPIPQFQLVTERRTNINRVALDLMHQNAERGGKKSLHFRMDDTDALSVVSLAKMKEALEFLPVGSFYSTPNGMELGMDQDQTYLRTRFSRDCATGWGVVIDKKNVPISVLLHRRLEAVRKGTSYDDPTFCAYLHTEPKKTDPMASTHSERTREKRAIEGKFDEKMKTQTNELISTHFPWTTRKELDKILRIAHGAKK